MSGFKVGDRVLGPSTSCPGVIFEVGLYKVKVKWDYGPIWWEELVDVRLVEEEPLDIGDTVSTFNGKQKGKVIQFNVPSHATILVQWENGATPYSDWRPRQELILVSKAADASAGVSRYERADIL